MIYEKLINDYFYIFPWFLTLFTCSSHRSFNKNFFRTFLNTMLSKNQNAKCRMEFLFRKYDSLCWAIKSDDWSAHFFAVEGGARGYCASTIRSYLKHLNLTGKLVRSSVKTLSSATLTASSQVWLCWKSYEWIIPNTADGITPTAMESSIPKPLRHSKSKLPFKQDNNRKYGTNKCGLINKGNTCYMNASLQCLSTMVKFCSIFFAYTNKLPQFVAAFVKIMSLLQTSKGALDPSYFLKCLKQIISKEILHLNYFPSRMLLKSYHIF